MHDVVNIMNLTDVVLRALLAVVNTSGSAQKESALTPTPTRRSSNMYKSIMAVSLLALSATAALAEDKTLYLGAYGGSTETLFNETLIPMWEEKTGAKVVYVPGKSTDTLAKLRAQEGAQELDVVFIDANHVMPEVCKTDAGNQPNITCTYHDDAHRHLHLT